MKKSLLIIFALCLSGIVSIPAVAQDTSVPTRPDLSIPSRAGQPRRTIGPAEKGAQDQDTENQPEFRPIAEIRKEMREKVKVSDAERDNIRQTLNDKKANITRVVTAFSCSSSLVVDVSDPRCSENPDHSVISYYSFRFKEYGEGPWTDVSFSEDDITAGNKWLTTGMIVDLGDNIDFSRIDTAWPEAKEIWNFKEAVTSRERNIQKTDLEKGVESGKLILRNKVKLQKGHTYLVRTISYRTSGFRAIGFGYNWHNTDTVAVFRVIETDADRTVTIAWKKLFQKIAPVLEPEDKDKDKSGK